MPDAYNPKPTYYHVGLSILNYVFQGSWKERNFNQMPVNIQPKIGKNRQRGILVKAMRQRKR